jgi:hypothetical protein
VLTVVKKDTGKMSVPNSLGTPRRAPSPTRGRGGVVEGKCWPVQVRNGPWEEDIIGLATFENCED